jgi:Protein of unknown function (DUF2793)
MIPTTPRSGMPLLAAAQAQKHVTHNEALLQLDALGCARILDRDLTAPPGSPGDGDTYLVHATATGDWTGQDGNIAFALDGGWRFYAPFAGLMAYVVDEAKPIVFDGAAWNDFVSLLSLENLPMLGVNTTADTTNKLAVKSSALLFDNIGNNVQAKLNKNASGDTGVAALSDELFGPRGVRPHRRRQFPLQSLARRFVLDRCACDQQDQRRADARGRCESAQCIGVIARTRVQHQLRRVL